VDSDDRADEAWLLGVQRKLYQWSRNNPEDCYRELWNWVTDLRNLRCAWRKIAGNKGSRSAGIDGMTVPRIRAHLKGSLARARRPRPPLTCALATAHWQLWRAKPLARVQRKD
jgi:retron-type reverse transcriptase